MATLQVVFAKAMEGPAQVIAGVPFTKQRIVTSGVSQTSAAVAGNETVAEVTVTGGNVWVQFGAAPTASAGNDFLILDGQTRYFGHIAPGFKLAVIDA